MTRSRGIPTATELAQAVEAFLREEVLPATEDRLAFLVRVAANVTAMLRREIELGPECEAAHARRLQALGVKDDAALCTAIRSGRLDDRMDEVMSAVRSTATERLRIVNPAWIEPDDEGPIDETSSHGAS